MNICISCYHIIALLLLTNAPLIYCMTPKHGKAPHAKVRRALESREKPGTAVHTSVSSALNSFRIHEISRTTGIAQAPLCQIIIDYYIAAFKSRFIHTRHELSKKKVIAATFAEFGDTVISACIRRDGPEILVQELHSGKKIALCTEKISKLYGVALSRNGSQLACSSNEGLGIWQLNAHDWESSTYSLVAAPSGVLQRLEFSHDNKFVLAVDVEADRRIFIPLTKERLAEQLVSIDAFRRLQWQALTYNSKYMIKPTERPSVVISQSTTDPQSISTIALTKYDALAAMSLATSANGYIAFPNRHSLQIRTAEPPHAVIKSIPKIASLGDLVQFSPLGERVALSNGYNIFIYDVASENCLYTMRKSSSCTAGLALHFISETRLVTWRYGKEACSLWEMEY